MNLKDLSATGILDYPENLDRVNSVIIRQKMIGGKTLHCINKYLKTDAYLAGGMLRDHYFKRPGKDYDIYVECDPKFDYDNFMIPLLNGIPYFENFDKIEPEADDESYSGSAIHSIYEGVVVSANTVGNTSSFPIQIIVVKEHPRIYIEEFFCCTLSKVWQTAGKQPVYHQEFLDSITDKTLRFDFSAFDSINFTYLEKIVNRFPDFKLDDKWQKLCLDKKLKHSYWR